MCIPRLVRSTGRWHDHGVVLGKYCAPGLMVLAFACSSQDEGDGEQSPAGSSAEPAPVAGGSTEDFNGQPDIVQCTTVSTVPLTERSPLGFAASEVLSMIEGNYGLVSRWVGTCSASQCVSPSACGQTDGGSSSPALPLANSQTVLRIGIEATGDALAHHDGTDAGDPSCTELLEVPVTLRLTSDDGAFDERISAHVQAERSSGAQVSVVVSPDELRGSLSADLAADDTVLIQLGAHMNGDEVMLSVNILILGAQDDVEHPLLRALPIEADPCSQEISRDSALEQ